MKHVIVTGGSRGLGAALVTALLEGGYRVSTCSRGPSPFVEELLLNDDFSSRFLWQQCDLGDPEQPAGFVASAVKWAADDGVYALINNAGIARQGILATMPPEDLESVLAVNLQGAVRMARLVSFELVKRNKGGRIINVSSVVGGRGFAGVGPYSASKAGLDGLTRALARELGPRQITVNSVAPGFMRSELTSSLTEAQLGEIQKATPLRRLTETADVVPVIEFLLSDAAGFITGQTITIDGGHTC